MPACGHLARVLAGLLTGSFVSGPCEQSDNRVKPRHHRAVPKATAANAVTAAAARMRCLQRREERVVEFSQASAPYGEDAGREIP